MPLSVKKIIEHTKQLRSTMFDRLLVDISTIVYLSLFIVLVLAIVARFAAVSLPWTEEMARYIFIISTFFGAAAAISTNEHIQITSFKEKLFSPKFKMLSDICGYILVLSFIVLMLMGYWKMVDLSKSTIVSTIKWLHIGDIYMIIYFSAILMGINCIRWLIVRICEFIHLMKQKDQSY